MGILNRMKEEADNKGLIIQSAEEELLTGLFNQMFYLEKNIEEETKFVKQMMTRGQEQQERVGLHASAIIETEKAFCYRRQVLSLIYRQLQGSQFSPDTMRIFEEGNAIHEKWQRLFIRAGYGMATDMDMPRYNERYMLLYTPDAIIKVPEFFEGQPFIVEIKSMNSFKFKKMKQHAQGRKQMYFYMRLSGIKKGIVLVDSKNDSKFRVFVYDHDPSIAEPFYLRLEKIRKAYLKVFKRKKMPKRHQDCNFYECKKASDCPMKDACYNRGMGRQRLK